MDSLLSSYASSDDDDSPPHQPPQPPHKPPSLPSSTKPQSKLFSSLPPPTFFNDNPSEPGPTRNHNPGRPNSGKKVVQFHPPKFTKPARLDDDDNEEEDEEEEERESKKLRQTLRENTSVKSLLSSMPAPKNSGLSSLGGPTGGRRTTIDAPLGPPETVPNVDDVSINDGADTSTNVYSYDNVGYEGFEQQQYYDGSGWSYGGNEGGLTGSSEVETFVGGGGSSRRRRKGQVPVEIVEVKQDELMKNRPTEDKSKLTGIAFGPSYQPASSKSKPSKLHKRKHQIGSLYFDVKHNETEHAERRAKGFLTKAQTQAKYGW